MTATEQSSRKVILGAGWANPLTHAYVIENASWVHVFADTVELTQGVDYTVTNVLNPAGYAVTIAVPGSWAPTNWVLNAVPPIDQQKDLTVGGTFGAKYEDGLDKISRRLQYVWDLARRGLKPALTTPVGNDPYTLPAPAAGMALGWNDAGTDLENHPGLTSADVAAFEADVAAAAASAAAASGSAGAASTSAANALASYNAVVAAIAALGSPLAYKGAWDASAGTFPSGGVKAGWTYTVIVGGTVGGVPFNVGDSVFALINSPSTTVYANNWFKIDSTDLVTSVAGRTGAVTIALADITDASAYGRTVAAMVASADLRNDLDAAPYVATRAVMKALDTTKETVCFLTEAGRQGIFVWTAGNFATPITADTLEGVYVKANAIASTAGAWVRFYVGPLWLEWFGGIADGATTNTAAFNAAIVMLPSAGGALQFGVGTYVFATAPAAISKPITLRGQGVPETILSLSFATGDFIAVSSAICNISDIKFTSTVTRTAGFAIKVDTIRANIYNCYLENQYKSIGLTKNCTLSKISFCEIRNTTPHATAFGSGGIDIGDTTGSPDPDSCTISFVNIGNDTSNHHYAGIHVFSATALTIVGCNILQGNFSILGEVSAGCGILNLKIDSTYCDSATTGGLYLTATGSGNIARVMATGSWFSTANQGDGVVLAAIGTGVSQGVTLVNCEASVNLGAGVKVADAKWKHVSAIGCRIAQNGFAGVQLAANAGDVNIQDCTIGAVDGMTGNATGVVLTAGTGTRISIQNNRLAGNTTALTNAATGANRIEGNEGYNSTPVGAAITVGASPYTYTAGPRPETVYIIAGTVSGVIQASTTIASVTNVAVTLAPNESVQVTYSSIPFMNKIQH